MEELKVLLWGAILDDDQKRGQGKITRRIYKKDLLQLREMSLGIVGVLGAEVTPGEEGFQR